MNSYLQLGNTPDEKYREQPPITNARSCNNTLKSDNTPDKLPRNSHRSRHHRRPDMSQPSPLTAHTLEADMPDIIKYAAMFAKLNARAQAVASAYVFNDRTLDFYHGAYVAHAQDYLIAMQSEADGVMPAIAYMIYAISHKIVLMKDLKPTSTSTPTSTLK